MLDGLIGNTPMIKIVCKYHDKIKNVYAKLEYYNYSGSIKDRIANMILLKSKEMGLLKENQEIVEATSGNTGIAFASLGAFYGHPVSIFMPDWVSPERVHIMKLYGAKVTLISKEEGGFLEAIRRSQEYAKKNNGFLPRQFDNELNILAHYETTGNEIVNKALPIDAFVSGIGTGGTLMGIAKCLKKSLPHIKILALEPSKMPILSGGKMRENHKIEGIGDDFIPSIVNHDLIDEVLLIDDEDAINMSRILARKLGLGVGISSGANFLAAVTSNYSNVVTVFADDFKKYLSTDLVKEVSSNPDLLSNQIEILHMEVIK